MSNKLQTYLITITVIEGRHYIYPNANTAIAVKIDNYKKCTSVKYNTDCPFYNEHLTFEFYTSLDNILDKSVIVSAIKPGNVICKQKSYGSVHFDVGIIWHQKDHQLYHKWVILMSTEKGGSVVFGYLQLDVCILLKGHYPKIPPSRNTNNIETNLFLPSEVTGERERVDFVFDVYRGADLIKRQNVQEGGKKHDNTPSAYIEVAFSGRTARTALKKNCQVPVWNERLTLTELFPPLCQRFRISLYHDNVKRATRYLNIRTISNDKDEGFLPTFGPSFVHFYSSNNLEGYLGKVLLSVQTCLLGDVPQYESRPNLIANEAPPLRENFFLKFESVTVFAVIFETSLIVRQFSDKAISFRLGCGPTQEDISDNFEVTAPIKCKTTNKSYSYLPINDQKLCLKVTFTVPDIRNRIYNYNFLMKISLELKSRLKVIEKVFQEKEYNIASEEANILIQETIDFVTSSCTKYLDIAVKYVSEEAANLDQKRTKMALKEIEKIKNQAKQLNRSLSKRKLFKKLEKFSTHIETLIDIVEDWPQIYLWMLHGNKRVAYTKIPARDVVHSLIDEEKGLICASLQTFFLHTEANYDIKEYISSACKTEMVLWMGLTRHLNLFLATSFNTPEVSKTLTPNEKHFFKVLVYIFQARVIPGMDKNSLCDPFVQAFIGSEYRQSKICYRTLTPVWDQTLIFPKIVRFGSLEAIAENPPTVMLELCDKDECCKVEQVGKSLIKTKLRNSEKHPHVKLVWEEVYNKTDLTGEILVAAELLEVPENFEEPLFGPRIVQVPEEIKPTLSNFRIEVVFWGARDLQKINLCQINRPKVVLEIGNAALVSDTLGNAKKNLNFTNPLQILDCLMPEEPEYAPPICLKMYDSRSFGITTFVGSHSVPMSKFLYKPMNIDERDHKLMDHQSQSFFVRPSLASVNSDFDTASQRSEVNIGDSTKKSKKLKHLMKKVTFRKIKADVVSKVLDTEDEADFDWWTKFQASLEEISKTAKIPLSHRYKLKVYQSELEKQPEFEHFYDTLIPFSIYKGKRTGDQSVDDENTTAIFKGTLRIYKWPLDDDQVTPNGHPLAKGFFQDYPSNMPVRYVLRVYCVKAVNLKPRDLNGKSDPYLRLTLNEQVINDREHKIMGQLFPVFGKCFEMNGTFPQDHTLTVAVMDYDAITADDLVGETNIDLENRFYTKHRAHCGLAKHYLSSGYCQWRDPQKPATILENLCRKHNISDLYFGNDHVRVASRKFTPKNFSHSNDADFNRQVLALEALNHWSEIPLVGCHLVPEHIETRSLFDPKNPGIEQGKLMMWIDILPCGELPTPKQVHITPKKPVPYELRVIVWNATNIKLDELDYMTGKKKADVFVKGWVLGPEDGQYTDIHYRCLSGQAKFNWRFIFKFDYLSSEDVFLIKKKTFLHSEEEEKLPCKLILQCWDNDTIFFNDFIGVLDLELSKLPRGASTSKRCSLNILDSDSPTLNLFKVRRTKGWWPFINYDQEKQLEVLVGCVELEFELLRLIEAEKAPAGWGRDEPQALPKPDRPESSFSWIRNPLAGLRYTTKVIKRKLIKLLIIFILVVVIIITVYTLWQLVLKKLVNKALGTNM